MVAGWSSRRRSITAVQSGVPSISSASAAMRPVSDSTCSRPISRSVLAPNSNPSPMRSTAS